MSSPSLRPTFVWALTRATHSAPSSAHQVNSRRPSSALLCERSAFQNDSTGVVVPAEYQHWLDGMLVNGTETFEGAVEGGFSVYTREIAGSIRPHHFPDLASLLMGKVHKTGGPRGPE